MQVWQGVASVGVILAADYIPLVWAVTLSVAFVVFAGPALYDCWKGYRSKRERALQREASKRLRQTENMA